MISCEIKEIYEIIIQENKKLQLEKRRITKNIIDRCILYIPEIENIIRKAIDKNGDLNKEILKKELESFYIKTINSKNYKLIYHILMLFRKDDGKKYIRYILQGEDNRQFQIQNKYII